MVAESPESPRLGGWSFGISSFPPLLEILSSNSSETPALHCHSEQNFFYMAYNSSKWVGEQTSNPSHFRRPPTQEKALTYSGEN